MNYILNMRVNKNISYILLINIIAMVSYLIGLSIIRRSDLVFRGWVNIFCTFNLLTFIIIVIISSNVSLCTKTKGRTFKVISSLITAIVVVLVCLMGVVYLAFSYAPEHTVYEQNQEVIAKVFPYGFHHTQVSFYEPVNIFLMRKSNIPSKFYDGSYDMYKKR